MKIRLSGVQISLLVGIILALCITSLSRPMGAVTAAPRAPILVFHEIETDQNGLILPWYSPTNLGESYDRILNLIFNYWVNLPVGTNGVKHYLQHRIAEANDGIGGDQLAMALSSWHLYYQYTGDQAVLDNMIQIADFYLDYGLSASDALWPNLPFPYNGEGDLSVGPGFFSRDLERGEGFTQPDKAGSFGAELVTLYKITGNSRYLIAAINIADTLSSHVVPGDGDNSPLPFRVNVNTGEIADSYTSNWTGALRLWDNLIEINQGNITAYNNARSTVSNWLKTYPIMNNKWGPFFEDIGVWSDTEINADTMAWYILEHPNWDANGLALARNILDWTIATFGDDTWNGVTWSDYGVLPIDEQTQYMNPGNSHTARHGSVELIYAQKTGDDSRKDGAIRQLNWATYMVDENGRNKYPTSDTWLTDGYGDYVRHYLRAMAAAPELAPSGQNHLLNSSSVVKSVIYTTTQVIYSTFAPKSIETLKLGFVPRTVRAGGVVLAERSDLDKEGWVYDSQTAVLQIRHDRAAEIEIDDSVSAPSYTVLLPIVLSNIPTVPAPSYTILLPTIWANSSAVSRGQSLNRQHQ